MTFYFALKSQFLALNHIDVRIRGWRLDNGMSQHLDNKIRHKFADRVRRNARKSNIPVARNPKTVISNRSNYCAYCE